MTNERKNQQAIPQQITSLIGDANPQVFIEKGITPIGRLTRITIPHSFKSEREVMDFAIKHQIPAYRNATSVTLEIWQ